MVPALTSSICFSSTATAGSAEMMNQPSTAASGISSHSFPFSTSAAPSSAPRLEKPTFTPVRNSTSPMYVYRIPTKILPKLLVFIRNTNS